MCDCGAYPEQVECCEPACCGHSPRPVSFAFEQCPTCGYKRIYGPREGCSDAFHADRSGTP